MPKNGEICDQSGWYRTLCCDLREFLEKGAQFPDCKRHINLTTIWKAIDEEKPDKRSGEGAA